MTDPKPNRMDKFSRPSLQWLVPLSGQVPSIAKSTWQLGWYHWRKHVASMAIRKQWAWMATRSKEKASGGERSTGECIDHGEGQNRGTIATWVYLLSSFLFKRFTRVVRKPTQPTFSKFGCKAVEGNSVIDNRPFSPSNSDGAVHLIRKSISIDEAPGAGPSRSQFDHTEPLLRQDSDGVHVERDRKGPHVLQREAGRVWLDVRASGQSLPAFSLQLASSPAHYFVAGPLPCLVVPPTRAPTSTLATFPIVPPHELVPATASNVSVRTYNPFRLEPSLPASSENPSTHDPLMERVIPTDAQISTFSELEGAVYPFAGPLVDMACVVVASRLDPRWDLEAVQRMIRDCLAYAGKQQPLSRASLESRAMEETVEVSEVEVGSGDEDRERDESETTWSQETGCWRVAPMPTPRPMEAAGGLHPMPVVIPQTDGDALSNDKDKSTTSTHEVDNPAGEPVVELVPLSSGGPMASWSVDD
ncbi:hypothetical protein HETIRDRAFT_424678 [Heterobasidion irregulare TC 32-1]|uniref:Uncharacterized protein n=1 Tax=Heterobasidion irregulare (strain TC 32-1) TaxID=747525 RepID=W4KJ69_HETIT|nr:uncharacterized protein HETIRDRAFT_424678 [Heterobasidion irregulare TC 32-1]ETW85355.1 hypothetical protein HETIRDRAFT_424678 [Heterobasidion irregulare TC 32-1]